MAANKFYHFDEETYSFVEVPVSRKRHWARLGWMALFAVILASGVTWGLDGIVKTPEELALLDENQALQRQLRSVNSRIDNVTEELEKLQSMDQDFYRTLLNAGETSDDVLQVGVGGSDPYPEFNRFSTSTSTILTRTATKIDQLERQILLQNESYRELASLAEAHEIQLAEMPAILPVNGRITSGYGSRFHPVLKITRPHPGLDFHAPVGTPVYATGDGVIEEATSGAGLGRYVKIEHATAGYVTVYAHLSRIAPGLKKGKSIKRGDVIGYSGNSGLSEAPHLHYEVRDLSGRSLNPLFFLAPSMTPAAYEQLLKDAESTTLLFD
ncbi:M23 family metallopeptidase [bacterium]|nr:M23 family metallopeptidase [bacterium]